MSSKKYNITQTIIIDGVNKKTTFTVCLDIPTLTTFLSYLEGGISVTEHREDLTDLTDSDKLITSYTAIQTIDLKTKDKSNLFTRIKPYRGYMFFKKEVDTKTILDIFKNSKPFYFAPHISPTDISTSFISFSKSK